MDATMGELEEEIRTLREKTAANRRQFLRVELETCALSLDMARFELAAHNIAIAMREVGVARKGIDVIERLLAQDPERPPEMQARLADLKASIRSIQEQIDPFEP